MQINSVSQERLTTWPHFESEGLNGTRKWPIIKHIFTFFSEKLLFIALYTRTIKLLLLVVVIVVLFGCVCDRERERERERAIRTGTFVTG